MYEQPKMWTYDDLAAFPEDGKRYEILDGELYVDGQPFDGPRDEVVVSPSPARRHQQIAKRLFVALYRALEETGRAELFFAPLDVIISPSRVVVPDLLVIARSRRRILQERGALGAPDLVIEILSPATTKHDRTRKRRFYAHAGVREYWIADPQASTIEVLHLPRGAHAYREIGWYGPGDRLRGKRFPVEIEIDAIFAR